MENDIPWCAECCTRHKPGGRRCPGSLLATGPERHGRRFVVDQNKRLVYFGVLIAEADDVWRARVFTYPNMLWSVPGGRGTIKFVADSAGEAENQAVEFLRAHCEERKWEITESDDETLPEQVGAEDSDRKDPRGSKEERYLTVNLRILFGEDKAQFQATTANLSVDGLFIATNRSVEPDRSIRMLLDVQPTAIPLLGTVVWVRQKGEPGQPKGFGVRLSEPPALYLRYVEKVQRALSGTDKELPARK